MEEYDNSDDSCNDLKQTFIDDKTFPTGSASYDEIIDYLVAVQEENNDYFDGYEAICVFDYLWDLYSDR